jgi:probable rRNA maturation factor
MTAQRGHTRVRVRNAQREIRVPVSRMRRLAAFAVEKLRIRAPGIIEITFVGGRAMKGLNRRHKRHDWVTDVLSFRYEEHVGVPSATVGEVLIAPSQARAYARQAGLNETQELGRYVVHGLLHWLGYEDRTVAEQKLMRRREDRLLRGFGL